jgi:hypothetical protein
MKDLMIEVDEQCPPHFVYVRVSGDEIRVTVNPQPEAEALAILREDVGLAIAAELDRTRCARCGPSEPGAGAWGRSC